MPRRIIEPPANPRNIKIGDRIIPSNYQGLSRSYVLDKVAVVIRLPGRDPNPSHFVVNILDAVLGLPLNHPWYFKDDEIELVNPS